MFDDDNAKLLDVLTERAVKRSGVAQADIRGLFRVFSDDEAPEEILALAMRFNALDVVEIVHIEATDRPLDPPPVDFFR